MTAREAIAKARAFRACAVSDDVLLSWLSDIEGKVQTEIFMLDVHDLAAITDMDTVLYAKYPHDVIYELYLIMQIDLYHKEHEAYSVSKLRFDTAFDTFSRHMSAYYRPADDMKRRGGGMDCGGNAWPYGTVQPFWISQEAYIGVNGNWWIGGLDTGIRGKAEIPYVGSNGNWWVGNEDTGVKARAEDGYTPQKGADYFTDADKEEIVSAAAEAAANEVWEYVDTVTLAEEVTQAYLLQKVSFKKLKIYVTVPTGGTGNFNYTVWGMQADGSMAYTVAYARLTDTNSFADMYIENERLFIGSHSAVGQYSQFHNYSLPITAQSIYQIRADRNGTGMLGVSFEIWGVRA